MTSARQSLTALLLAGTILSAPLMLTATMASAETVLRLDEVAVGELDPAKASDYADSILMFNLYDTLVMPRQGGPGMVPHLATAWEGEGTTYTFTLRDDVKFQSGNTMTADDVVYSFDRMKALGQGLSYLFGVVEKAEAVDATTVRFTLTEPNAPFVASLARLPIIDKATVVANTTGDDWGQAYLSANSAGSGAYTVVSHNPQEETVMAKGTSYFLDVPAVAPDTVRLRYGLEAATVRTLIANGEHDIASQWLPPEVIRAIAEGGGQLLTETGTGAFYMKMNTTKAPLDDVHCRRALSMAFDYETAIKMISITDTILQGSPATGAIPQGMFGAFPADKVMKRDVEGAKAELAQCAHDPASFKIQLSWIAEVPLEERFALLMQANLAEIGVQSEIVKLPWALFAEQVSKPENTPNVSQLFNTAMTGDPDTLLYGMYHSSAGGTWASPEYLKDAEVDRLLGEGRTGADDAAREAAYSALNARLLELAPSIFGYDTQAVFAASNRVKVPALSDPAMAFGLDGMGFTFRLMEMTE